MRIIFKGLVGAAMLLSASAASAQDYTWTLSNFYFDKWGTNAGPTWPNSEYNTTAEGTLVLSKSGSGYVLKSYNFTTTEGDSGLTAVYDSNENETFSTGTGANFRNFIDMVAVDEETRFRLIWSSGALIDEMDSNGLDSEVELNSGQSREYQVGGNRRYNGTGADVCTINANVQTVCLDATPGTMTLTNISRQVVATPEPGTMAVLGAGLLGLFAARRRRAA